MIAAKHYVKTAERLYFPGEVIPDGELTLEQVGRLIEKGAVVLMEDTEETVYPEAVKIELPKSTYEAFAEDEPEEAPANEVDDEFAGICAPDAAEAVVVPAKKGGKKGGKK